jgi:hypothetical protein
MTTTYERIGPPFNFMGRFTDKQKASLEKWIGEKKPNFPEITKFHRIRAHQLRKASGVLEQFFKADDPLKRNMKATFEKDEWKPPEEGYFVPTTRDDHLPADAMAIIKDRFQEQMALDHEAVFRMNFIRTRFEWREDAAQETEEGAKTVDEKLADLTRYFADPHYQGVLVNTGDTFKGEPRFRTHPLDKPTAWERANVEFQVL